MEQSTRRDRKPRRANAVDHRLFLLDPASIIAGLEVHVDQVGMDTCAAMVLLALEAYGKGESFPPGMSSMVFRFLCVTAGLGLLDQLAEHDRRSAYLLVRYFTSRDKRLEDLSDLGGGISTGRISQLISAALTFLWETLPDHPSATMPLDKHIEFPRPDLMRAPIERSRALLAARFGTTTTNEAMRKLVESRWRRTRTSPLDETAALEPEAGQPTE